MGGPGGRPTPPISLDLPSDAIHARFQSAAVDVPDKVIDHLREVCAVVITDIDERTEAGRDWWPLTIGWALAGEVPARPAAIARPSSAAEVAAVLAACNQANIPVTASAGRSGVCGNAVPAHGGIVLDMTGLTGIVAVDDESLLVDVAAGTFGDVFENTLRQDFGLTLGHWPQSIVLSTVGGWLACRSAGQYSTRYGKIEDMVVGMEVALADGRLVRTGGTAPRSANGPDLTQLMVGSEGTLGVITEARFRVHPVPTGERRAAYGFASFPDGLAACRRILRRGATPAVLRLYDTAESRRSFQMDTNVLIVLDEGDPTLIDAVMAVVRQETATAVPLEEGLAGKWLEHRNDTSALETIIRQGITLDTIEIAARWSALPAIYEQATKALLAIEGTLVASAHQSHAYPDGACLYFTFAGRPPTDGAAGAVANASETYYRRAWDAVMSTTLANGGSISHHHGIGLNRGRHLARALGPAYGVLLTVKSALDPNGILNPSKLGLPSPFGEAPWP